MKTLKRILIIFIIVGGVYYFSSELKTLFLSIKNSLVLIVSEQIGSTIKNKNSLLPGPLVDNRSADIKERGELTVEGILQFTNLQRMVNGGLPALTLNSKLSLAAEMKVDDMFAKNYFEHTSPSGITPGDIIKNAGYDYILVGENLAMGWFKNDDDLVDAWMDSPGHRANILGERFLEIGISAKKGFYDGEVVWIAVQEFGTNASLCEAPNESDVVAVNNKIKELEKLKVEIEELKYRLTGKANSILVNSYNELVKEYNDGVLYVGQITERYNKALESYNTCLSEYVE